MLPWHSWSFVFFLPHGFGPRWGQGDTVPLRGQGLGHLGLWGLCGDAGFRVYGPVGQVEDYIEELKRRVAI